MNIGFDLDKIFINHPPLIPSWLMQKLYGEKSNGHLSYRIPGKIEQLLRQFSHIPFLRHPIQENLQLVAKAKNKKNIHLFLISSRYNFLKKRTNEIIEKNNFKNIFSGLFFNYNNQQPHIFKGDMIIKNHIQRFVDDDLPLLQFLATKHPETTFFWLNPKRNDKLKKNLYAITHLSTVFENI